MKTTLKCPCGTLLQATDEDQLVARAQEHLAERHPELHYEPEQILFMAY